MKGTQAEIAVNRFGLGARPGDIGTAAQDPRGWLLKQMTPPVFTTQSIGLDDMFDLYKQRNIARKEAKAASQGNNKKSPQRRAQIQIQRKIKQLATRMTGETLSGGIRSNNALSWRLLDFFSNHFSVSNDNRIMAIVAPLLERDAIAPNIFGRFEDLLLAVIHHPGMLLYLNNEKSFGPESMAVTRKMSRKGGSKRGLNENLAREILELHTLGVNGGYRQNDVNELAKAISGWSVQRTQGKGKSTEKQKGRLPGKDHSRGKGAGFVFRPYGHEPGDRIILGKTYPEGDIDQGRDILKDLARHPSTAAYVSFKLARHFIADKPSERLVDAMSKRWLETKGNLGDVVTTLVSHPDAWGAEQAKLKTPREFVQSAYRASGLNQWNTDKLLKTLAAMGQEPFEAGSPAGYPDTLEYWSGGTAMLSRVEWAYQFAGTLHQEPEILAAHSLGAQLSKHTRTAIKRAESRQQGITLWLMSPEFQRR